DNAIVTVHPTPQAFPAGPMEMCDDGSGQAPFDLTQLNNVINGGSGDQVNWYRNIGLTSQISNPMNFITGSTTVFAVVTNGLCESEIIEVELIVHIKPNAFSTQIEKCEDIPGSGVATFDLTELNDIINGGSGDQVTYFQDPGGTIPISSPHSSSSTTIYARVFDGQCESEIVSIQLIVNPSPDGNDLDIMVCEDFRGLGSASIDLDDYKNAIAVGAGLNIDFFEDPQFQLEIRSPYEADLGTTIIYARINNGSCVSRPIEITITVFRIPGIREGEIEICEDPPGSGFGLFELDSLEVFVIGNQQGLDVLWYADSSGSVPLSNPYAGKDTIVFAQSTNGICESEIVEVRLVTIPKPIALPHRDTACADQTGKAFFDLTQFDHLIAADTSSEEVFYASDSLFKTLVNTNFRTDDTIIYARVERGDCVSKAVEVVLIALPAPIFSGINDVVACDSFELDRVPGINLSGNQAYYTQRDAQGVRYLPGDFLNRSQRVYYFDSLESCTDEDSFNLTIINHPEAGDSNTVSVCEGAVVDLSGFLIDADTGGIFTDLDSSMALNGNNFNTTGLNDRSFRFKYMLDGKGPCGPDSTVITIEVQRTIHAGRDSILTICLGESIDLNNYVTGDPGGIFTDLDNSDGLNGAQFLSLDSGPGTFRISYEVGDGVVCPKDEAILTVTIEDAIVIEHIQDVIRCDFFVLPPIDGVNTDLAYYFTGPQGTGNELRPGDTIRAFQTIYAYGNEPGYCEDEESFIVWIIPSSHVNIDETLCYEDFLIVNGNRYDRDRPEGEEVIRNGATNGCDSTIVVDLEFYPQAVETIQRTLCRGQSVTINGTVYDLNNPAGQEILLKSSFRGCDSIINIDLTFDDFAVGELKPLICKGDSITINGRQYYEGRSTGSDTLLGQGLGGCDSIVNIEVAFHDPVFLLDSTLCEGEAITINGRVYDATRPSGTEILVGQSWLGCDSVVNVNLSFDQHAQNNIDRTLCFGDALTVNGTIYDESNPSGVEVITGGAQNGCDSIISVDIEFRETVNESVTGEICARDTIRINGQDYHSGKVSGMDTIIGGSQAGCDSVIIVDLTVIDDVESEISDLLCPDDQIIINGSTYDIDNPGGIEVFPGMAQNGCDSVVYIDLQFEDFEISPSYQSLEIELGDSVQVDLTANFNYDSLYWSPSSGLSCTQCLNPVIKTTENSIYSLTVISDNGCLVVAMVEVLVDQDIDLFVPNSFSPNGDNLNDRLKLYVKEGKVEQIKKFNIYSRWGELIYSESGTNPDDGTHIGWDGTFNGERLNPGVYVYHIDVTLIGDQKVKLNGSVTLIE
ncbi:MAG: gliding motility-associated C-terminal domain-containing protein, partial [Saprospiraceae bacterium]|nr:gliding motility-associated C-terminal domain-containing protein [Saprospiraceae bacterium]